MVLCIVHEADETCIRIDKGAMMQAHIIGDKASFAIAFSFFDDTHETELALYLNGVNILEFERNGKTLTT